MSTVTGFRENQIALKNLKLWSENPRFPQAYFGKPENELIDYIVSVPHYKIKAFGKEVVEDFDMPIFEKLAIYDGEGENTAYEGNRRLTTYKLLLNPNLTSNKEIRDYFTKLKRSINIDENFKIDCVISNDKKETLRYVNRKHLNNNNEVTWGTVENANAKLRWLDNPDKLDILKSNLSIIIRNLNIPTEDKEKVLGRGYVTTLFRVLNTNTAAKFFNLVFDDDNNLISENNFFLDTLEVIIYDILGAKIFNGKIFSRLSATDIEEYLKSITFEIEDETSITNEETKDPSLSNDKQSESTNEESGSEGDVQDILNINVNPIAKDSKKGKSGAVAPVKKNKINSKSSLRKHLIPKTCKLTINENKINNIYRELRDDLLIDDSLKAVPNAVGVLFRVFIEVSLDHYAEKKHGYNFKKDDGITAKVTWVVNKMIEIGYPKKLFTNINLVGSSKKQHSYLSIEKFHQYIHSSTLEPSSSELKSKWNLLEPFIKTLWDDLNKA